MVIDDGFWVFQVCYFYGQLYGYVYDEKGFLLVGVLVFYLQSEWGIFINLLGYYELWFFVGELYL